MSGHVRAAAGCGNAQGQDLLRQCLPRLRKGTENTRALQDQETDYSTDYWLPGDGGLGGSRRILSIRRVTAGVKD